MTYGREPLSGAVVLDLVARIPVLWVVVACLTIGLAPFTPEPHLVEKVRMLVQGSLTEPVDVFDLLLHAAPWLLLALRLFAGVAAPGD
jgi:hypothetical protein